MLVRFYQVAGVGLLAAYGASSLFGWEFGRAVQARQAPERHAVVSRGWFWGRSTSHYSSSSSGGTRSGWGGGGFGGK